MRKQLLACSAVLILSAPSAALAGTYGEAEEATESPTAPSARMETEVEEATPPLVREFAGFFTDAETSRGLWAEIGSLYVNDDTSGADIDGAHTFLHVSYGQEMWEAGINLPYDYVHIDTAAGSADDDGFGDLSLWAKVLPVRTDIFTFGGGMVVSFPTGDDSGPIRFSSDEYGFNPFLTAGVLAGPVYLRTHLGYSRFTDADESDALTYSASVLAPIGDVVVLRAELVGQHFFDFDGDPVSVVPGVDVRIPLGDAMEMLIRPTGAIGISDTADWQLGLSLAFAQI